MIEIEYDGEYPCLCGGTLRVTADGETWQFPEYCLSSGGNCYVTEEGEEVLQGGPWSIIEWPKDFPQRLQKAVLAAINEQIPWGCCGGCL